MTTLPDSQPTRQPDALATVDSADHVFSATAAALMHEARAGIIFSAQHDDSGLATFDHSTLRGRILSVTKSGNGQPQVRIDSTGFTLDQKIFIEKAMLRYLDANNFSEATIYFQKASSVGQSASGPTPVKRKSPFGLNISKQAIPGVKTIIVVASGKGGVGKSTVSTNLAAGLARLGLKTGLMDCDVYGPSSPTMLGVSGSMSIDGTKLVPLVGHDVHVVSFGFLSDVKTPVLWRGPMVAKAIEQLCYDVKWGDLDVLILDLPPGTGDVQLTLAERLPVAGAIIVTTPQDVALIDAHKAVSLFERLEVPILGVVENMAHYTCTSCGHKEHIFGHEAFEEFLLSRKLSLLTRIPLAKEIRELSDSGTPIVLSDSRAALPYQSLANFICDKFRHASSDSNAQNEDILPPNHTEKEQLH